MSRRQGGLLEALFILASRLPWWLSLTLAVASYHGLGLLAVQPLPEFSEAPRAPAIIVHFLHWFALAGQYILPFAFSVGAIASILVALRGKQIYRRISKTPNRHSLDGLRWREFEILMLEWFRKQGFAVQDTDLGPDGGVDIVLRKDGRTYLVQCKHWRAYKVGVTVVRELRGVMASEVAAGGFVVTCRNLPEAITQGDTLEAAIEMRIEDGLDIPLPSKAKRGEHLACLPVDSAMKAAVYLAMKEQGLSKSDLARRIDLDEVETRRILDPKHSTNVPTLERALLVLGKRVEVVLV